jgi:hypothetical protein
MRQRFDQNLSLSFAGELDISKSAGRLATKALRQSQKIGTP